MWRNSSDFSKIVLCWGKTLCLSFLDAINKFDYLPDVPNTCHCRLRKDAQQVGDMSDSALSARKVNTRTQKYFIGRATGNCSATQRQACVTFRRKSAPTARVFTLISLPVSKEQCQFEHAHHHARTLKSHSERERRRVFSRFLRVLERNISFSSNGLVIYYCLESEWPQYILHCGRSFGDLTGGSSMLRQSWGWGRIVVNSGLRCFGAPQCSMTGLYNSIINL